MCLALNVKTNGTRGGPVAGTAQNYSMRRMGPPDKWSRLLAIYQLNLLDMGRKLWLNASHQPL